MPCPIFLQSEPEDPAFHWLLATYSGCDFTGNPAAWYHHPLATAAASLAAAEPCRFNFCMWEMLLYVPLPTNASRMRNEINPCNYMHKSNQQPYSLAANSKRSSVDDKVSDSSAWLMLMHYAETGILRASTSLRQFCLTYADAFHFEIEKTAAPGVPAHKQVRARLRQVGNPGATQSAVVPPSTMPPKHSLDGATSEETVSL